MTKEITVIPVYQDKMVKLDYPDQLDLLVLLEDLVLLERRVM